MRDRTLPTEPAARVRPRGGRDGPTSCWPSSTPAHCELDHNNARSNCWLRRSSRLSAPTRVNLVTPVLFDRFPTPTDLATADPEELEEIIHSTGFFRAKARSLIGMAAALEDRFDGAVPGAMADLVTIPGVGRKTANVVRSVAMDLPGLPVDTHVLRLSKLLGLTSETDPVKVELELNPMVPAGERGDFSLRLILHGRRVCIARRPRCSECVLAWFCPSASI
ncbi:MAG: endonuclease III [Microthrixaceae bacterium]|nr:endonuclease III [Microthrixaceae bacterium]